MADRVSALRLGDSRLFHGNQGSGKGRAQKVRTLINSVCPECRKDVVLGKPILKI